MPVSDSTFIKDMLRFTERSLSWCARESEKETMLISEAVDLIYADLKKRSNLSKESLSALESFLKDRGDISEPTVENASESNKQMKLMMKDLSKLGDKDRDLARFINPVVENLQFQEYLNLVPLNLQLLKTGLRLQRMNEVGNLLDFFVSQNPVLAKGGHDGIRVLDGGVPDLSPQRFTIREASFHGNKGRADVTGERSVRHHVAGQTVTFFPVEGNFLTLGNPGLVGDGSASAE